MLGSGDTAAAIRLGLCIVHDVDARHGFPLVRVGKAHRASRGARGRLVRGHGESGGAGLGGAGGGQALLTAATKATAGEPSVKGRPAPWACRLIRCVGWQSILGVVRVGSPTKAWILGSSAGVVPV